MTATFGDGRTRRLRDHDGERFAQLVESGSGPRGNPHGGAGELRQRALRHEVDFVPDRDAVPRIGPLHFGKLGFEFAADASSSQKVTDAAAIDLRLRSTPICSIGSRFRAAPRCR